MDVSWRLNVYDPLGTYRYTIQQQSQVPELGGFFVGGDGDCKEANFRAVVGKLGIKRRDVVVLEVAANGSAYQAVYRGYAVKPGAGRRLYISEIRLAGLKERFRELELTGGVVKGGDVGAMVSTALSNAAHLPGGVTSQLVGIMGFALGDYIASLATVHDFMEAMAAACPGFVVPAGGSYQYNGVTYGPGTEIPPATWGVNAQGAVFFLRNFDKMQLIQSGNTTVDWLEEDAQNLVTNVTVGIGAAYEEKSFNQVIFWNASNAVENTLPALPGTLAHRYADPLDATYRAGHLEAWPDDAPAPTVKASFATVTTGNLTNPANATDASKTTFAQISSSTVNAFIKAAFATGAFGDGVSFAYSCSSPVELLVQHTCNIDGKYVFHVTRVRLEPSADKVALVVLTPPDPRLLRKPTLISSIAQLSVQPASNAPISDFKVYDFVPLVLDKPLLDAHAKSLLKLPAEDPAEVLVKNALKAPQPKAQLTLASGEVLTRKVEVVRVSLTKAEGLRSYVRLEQLGNADLSAEAALLDQKLHRATLKARR